MNAMLMGVGLNFILAPILIFGFGMGVQGAAIATVLSQGLASAWLLLYCINGKGAVKLRSETLKPDLNIIKEIGAIGLGAFVMDSANNVMMIFAYNALASYGGDAAIAVFGIIIKIISFIFLPILGMAYGLQPIVGYNYGAKKYERVSEAVKLTLVATTVFGIFALLVMSLFKEQLLGIFSADPEYMEMGKTALTIMVLGTPLIGINVVTSILFQALGKARPAFILSISRQLLFLIPLIIVLPGLYGLAGVWAAFPIADILAFMLSSLLLFRIYRVFKRSEASSKISTGAEIAEKISKAIPFVHIVPIHNEGKFIGINKIWNILAKEAAKTHDIFGYIGDDMIFRTQNWDISVINEFDTINVCPIDQIKLVHCDDGHQGSRLSVNAFVHKKYYEVMGYFCREEFPINYSDSWMYQTFNAFNRITYLKDILIEHNHWVFGSRKRDKTADRMLSENKDKISDALWLSLAPEKEKDIKKLGVYLKIEPDWSRVST